MRCDEFEARMQDVLDRRAAPEVEPDLAEHLATCPSCRQMAAALGAAIATSATLVVPPSPDDLAARVLAELEPAPIALPRWRWTMIPLATAAGILVALPLAWWLAPGNSVDTTPQVAATPLVTAPLTAPLVTAPPAIGPAAENTMVSLIDLAATWLPLPAAEKEAARSIASPSGEPWSQEVTEGFEPVTRSTTGALESLWKAIPASGEDARS